MSGQLLDPQVAVVTGAGAVVLLASDLSSYVTGFGGRYI
jgi:hypothetical protein